MNDELLIEQHIMKRLSLWQYFNMNMVARENENFTPPLTGIWIRPVVLGGINSIASVLTDGCVKVVGQLTIQVFVPKNSRTYRAKEIAGSLRKHFEMYSVDKLQLLAGSVITAGDNGDYYQYNVVVPYEYY